MKTYLIAVIAVLALGSQAFAQGKPKLPQLPLAPPCIGDTNLPPGCKPSAAEQAGKQLANILAKPFLDIADLITTDTGDAIKLSTEIPALQDGNGQACWRSLQQFADVVKAHPIPLTFHVATDIEALRLLSMATNNVCKNTACTQVFTELANGVQQLAPINASFPVPSLTALCAKVPQVAVVAPTPDSTPAPAAPKTP